MHAPHRTLPYWTVVLCLAGCFSTSALARQTTLSGTISTGVNVRARSYDQEQATNKNDNSTEEQQKLFISPGITISSIGLYDQLGFHYAPSFNYDLEDDDSSLEHSLALTYQRQLSSKWTLNIADSFILSDDPDASSTLNGDNTEFDSTGSSTSMASEDSLARDQFSRTYWTNAASIQSSYALFETTTIGGGYTYSVLRNDGSGDSDTADYDEYDRHAFFANISHGFNAYWRTNLGVNYTRGLYDQPDADLTLSDSANADLNQYGATVGIDYVQSVRNFFPFLYSFSETQYDGDTRSDTQSQQWSIGWNHSFDEQTSFAIGGGPSYAKTAGLEGTWGYNAYLNFSKTYQHATCSLQLSKGYETDNFSGTEESGLKDTYAAGITLAYQYTKNLGLNLFGTYTRESQIDPQGIYYAATTDIATETTTGDKTYDKDTYEAGIGLNYSFARWYSLGLKYSYYLADGQLDSDQYDEHRVMLNLSASKEFWQW